MLKLLSTDDFDFGEPAVQILPVTSYGTDVDYVKTAAVLQQELSEIKPVKGTTFIHVYAVGDTEKYGANKNGDGFKEADNKVAHPRFVESGRVHKHHQNKDPSTAVGQCKLSAHNDDMSRIELVLGLDNEKCAQEIQDYESGKELPVSMGCKVAFDVCSICGHKAPSPKFYCEHTKTAMGRILEDGQHVYVDNPDPKYFEISLVRRPADRCGYTFRKVAGEGVMDIDRMTSVDMFKAAGLYVPAHIAAEEAGGNASAKLVMLHKLAEIEKEIEGKLTPVDETLMDSTEDEALDDDDIAEVHKGGDELIGGTLGGMAEAKVLVPLKDFLKLINRSGHFDTEDVFPAVQNQMPGIFGRMLNDDPMACCGNAAFDGDEGEGLPGPIKKMISQAIPSLGMGQGPLDKRVTITVISAKPKVKVAAAPRIYRDDPLVKGLAELYATYKLAFVTRDGSQNDKVLVRATVTGNYKGTQS